MNLSLENILIQGIGFIALILVVLSFQKNSRSHTLIFLFISSMLFGIHFYLLGAYTGAALNGVGAVRALVFNLRDKYKLPGHVSVMWFFIGIFTLAGLYTYSEPFDVLPVIAMNIECFALWNRNTRHVRFIFLTARPFWISYNIISMSIAGIVSEIFLIVSLSVAIWRFDKNAGIAD